MLYNSILSEIECYIRNEAWRWTIHNRINRQYDPCVYCGNPSESWDHLDAICMGGLKSNKQNQERSCFKCNQNKKNLSVIEYLMVKNNKKLYEEFRNNHISANRQKILSKIRNCIIYDLRDNRGKSRVSQLKKKIRNKFKSIVFTRDQWKCKLCSNWAIDAHHITDRSLMPNGGYIKENGISLCEQCHLDVESKKDDQETINKLYQLIGSSKEKALAADS